MAHDVFISYSSNDKPQADAICARLEAQEIRCWIAPRDVLPGSDYAESIVNAIESSRALVVVFSSNANDSHHLKKEVERAVNKGVPIVPVRIEDVKPSKSMEYFISSQHWLDALTQPLEDHIDHLVTALRALLDRPASPAEAEAPAASQATSPSPTPPPRKRSRLPLALVGAALVIAAIAAFFLWPRPDLPLPGGSSLVVDQRYYSSDERFYLVFQADGNLCTYTSSDDHFVSGSYQSGAPLGGLRMEMQEDGNLCIYDATRSIWCTMQTGPGNELSIDGNGRIVVLSSAGVPVWTAQS